MPTEFRFDDLDLREEPESDKSTDVDGSLQYTVCCTTRNTCTTDLC